MPGEALRSHADRFLAVAIRHPECLGGRVSRVADAYASVEIDMNVEMPLHMKADGISPNGVRRIEPVTAELSLPYPWSPPTFSLRPDFPRDLPHLLPGSRDGPPRPCLVDGSPREYFYQFGLVEGSTFHLVHQLSAWLRRAAEGTLNNPDQGWEPTFRYGLSDFLVVDAEACRSMVEGAGGFRILNAKYFRSGSEDAPLSDGAAVWIEVGNEVVPLKRSNKELFTSRRRDDRAHGNTVCCVIWPDKLPDGSPFESDRYMPESVSTLGALRRRAEKLRCIRSFNVFMNALDHYFDKYVLRPPVPIAIVLCARRPYHLIGSSSAIELLPYVIELRARSGRETLFAAADNEPTAPAIQLDVASPALLRRVSGAPEVGTVSILGCGSVGSKLAMHLARSGVTISVVSDKNCLAPHNMARHALARPSMATNKAEELASELTNLGQTPRFHKGDLVTELMTSKARCSVLPKEVAYGVNATASLGVREALSNLDPKVVTPRLAEVALFGRGNGGFLLIEGSAHNPTLCDLVAELNATADSARLRQLLFNESYGLTEVQIGQGCGSLTMPMTDMRLSAMTAVLSESLLKAMQEDCANGRILIGTRAENTLDTDWSWRTVAPFHVVPVEPVRGWTLRVSQRVLDRIHMEMTCHPGTETGGVIIGTCSERLRIVTVVDVLPAPPDSVRSAGGFTLGTCGLKRAIEVRHSTSGGTLFDVGTWHSHLADQGPSPRDEQTARELASERPPPSVLLIATPNRLYALMHPRTTP